MAQRYWLLKSDPASFGWEDLKRSPRGRTVWDGIRNYQARNRLRDEVRRGDGVLFYHSQSDKAVVGTCRVTRGGFPEPGKPPWVAIEIALENRFATPVTLDAMKAEKELASMELLRKGSRLSVMAVTASEWSVVTALGGSKRTAPRTSAPRRRRST